MLIDPHHSYHSLTTSVIRNIIKILCHSFKLIKMNNLANPGIVCQKTIT